MSKARDRANRSGTDPVFINNAKLRDSSGNLLVQDASGNSVKLIAEELHLGDSATGDLIIMKRSASGAHQFQTQASGGSAADTGVGGVSAYATLNDLPTSASDGDQALVIATNILYIWKTSGWYKIATITNAEPTISSAGNASYTFATDGTPVIVEITASDPEVGTALQYRYQVTVGSIGSTATVTSSATSGGTYSAIAAGALTSNKFFKITPTTNTAHPGSFTLTFSASDGVNVATSSASAFSLTFATYGSVLFDGSGDYLSIPHSASFYDLGLADWTIECWVKFTDTSVFNGIFQLGKNVGALAAMLYTDGKLKLLEQDSAVVFESNTVFVENEWYHIAFTNNDTSNTQKLYVNGVQESNTGSKSTVFEFTEKTIFIGGRWFSSAFQRDMNGYISNFRIVGGSEVYTSNFTPPTQSLTDVTNTKLLTAHKNNEVVDASSSNYTITKVGNARSHVSSPFPWNTTGYGSLHFDGSGDRAIAKGSNLAIGTNNFTIEYWLYAKNFDTVGTVWDNRNDGENVSMLSNNTTNGEPRLYANAGYRITANPPMNENEWNHIAFQRASNVTKMYLNGIEQTTTYSDTNNYPGQRFFLGSEKDTTTEFDGYISNFREVVGSNVYTPTALSGWSGSIYMSGGTLSSNGISGSYTMGTGDFTIETWFKYTASATLGSNDYLFDLGTSNDIRITFGSGNINVDDGGQVFSYGMHSTIDTARWYHLAYTRTGGTSSLYLDGQLKASIGQSNYNHAETTFTLGNYGGGGSYVWSGYLTDFRIVKGKAVYTGNFTRPTGPLTKTGGTYPSSTNISNPTASQTVLLIGNNSSSITDVSDTGHTLTPSGSISASSSVPTGNSIIVPTSPLTAVSNTKLLTAQRSVPLDVTSGSTLFDGTNDNLSIPNIPMGSGAYTIEMWFYPTTISNYVHLYDGRGGHSSSQHATLIQLTNTGTVRFYSTTFRISGSDTAAANTWNHVALEKVGNVNTLYLNGISQGTYDDGGTTYVGPANNVGRIGCDDNGGSNFFPGYISNFRMVVGSAVYNGNFALPTSALTAISNTQLLTCQNSTGSITDASSNNHTITANGGAAASTFVAQVKATDQSSSPVSFTTVNNTRNAKTWPFNYNG